MNKIKLFTFPYAGGNSNIYRPWKKKLNDIIELHPVELPGRGARMFDPLCNSIEETVINLQNLFSQNISDYALFGHSMGTIIIIELLSLISEKGIKMPLHVFFSGRQAPHIKSKESKIYHLMDEEQFKREIIQLGGTPEEIFNDQELAQLFLPVLKNDFKMCETYTPDKLTEKYNINFSILAGTGEGYTEDELTAYGCLTNGGITVTYFKGGHFFIKESEKEVIDYINSTLLNYSKS